MIVVIFVVAIVVVVERVVVATVFVVLPMIAASILVIIVVFRLDFMKKIQIDHTTHILIQTDTIGKMSISKMNVIHLI